MKAVLWVERERDMKDGSKQDLSKGRGRIYGGVFWVEGKREVNVKTAKKTC